MTICLAVANLVNSTGEFKEIKTKRYVPRIDNMHNKALEKLIG